MNKLCRTAGMILLFLLLATGPLSPAADAASKARFAGPFYLASSDGREAPSSPFFPRWFESVIEGGEHERGRPGKVEPQLRRFLARADDGQVVRVVVHLHERMAIQHPVSGPSDADEARSRLVASLRATADRTQAPVRAYLDEEQTAGRVLAYEPLWVVNAIAVTAHPSSIHALAAHPAVASVGLDHWRRWVRGEPSTYGSQSLKSGRVSDEAIGALQRTAWTEWNISRIRADEVWHSLRISGTGTVVAGMDTGVDWLHPALRRSYRGHNPHGPSDHRYSWFDATDSGALYPVDGHGHGSHTLGTIVGQDGIGVAPGARWIAVRMLDRYGYGYDSWIHAGFQWLLAPGGDPSQAPDVVNCSWGSDNAHLTTFQDDLRALRAAGLVAVFANGNGGPSSRSLSSPASLPEAIAVGAADTYDRVANFSGRGPSPWGEIRPHVVAPGVDVTSSIPGGAYGSMQGTSMAAPHVSGVVAMLRSVSPTLSVTTTLRLITGTAETLGHEVPDNTIGWGHIDAFAAVAALAEPAFITGTVSSVTGPEPGTPNPIAGARVIASPHGRGGHGAATTAKDGSYRLALAPGTYDLRASAFGYQSDEAQAIPAGAHSTTRKDFSLEPEPTGAVGVRITNASGSRPVTATVTVLGTPYEVITHTHIFELPADAYTVRAFRPGYRVVTSTVAITVGATTSLELALPDAPTILLVDSGGWYYESQIQYFRQALDDLAYAYDEWSVLDLWTDVPSISDLRPYDVVIWSAPRDAPGYIGAGDAMGDYLEGGGRLFLTGQDVGLWDGGGTGYYWSPYFRNHLKVRFVADNAPARQLTGYDADILAGQALTIAGPGGADNQAYPDVIAVADADAANPILRYQGDGCGGARVGTCLDYRAVYLPFGFEAINDRATRRQVLERSLDWLVAPPPVAGLELSPSSALAIGPPGSRVTHTLRLRHTGQGGGLDEVTLGLEGAAWPTELSQASLTLEPCSSSTVSITVTIPPTASWDLQDVVTLTARSSLSPTMIESSLLETKAPAPILLVDDDRWYDQQATYRQAMSQAGLKYDVWDTGTLGGGHRLGPAHETLQWYPVVVWWTGYDWYAPVTGDEEASLRAYLDGGGRLMLSSQDFLHDHYDGAFAQRYLGVLTYTEAITPTGVEGVSENPVGQGLGPWPLDYPAGYQNWSDGVVPERGVDVAFRDQGQRGVALTRRGAKDAALFLALPFEAFPQEEQPLVVRKAVGWLSWLGGSTFDVSPRSVKLGQSATYTLTLRNDGRDVVNASMSNTLPSGVRLLKETITGPGALGAAEDRLYWRGALRPGAALTFTYQAVIVTDTNPHEGIVNRARVVIEDHAIGFERHASVRVDAPDLSPSAFGCSPSVVLPAGSAECTLILRNTGSANAELATARLYPPGEFAPTGDLPWASQGTLEHADGALRWSGPLKASGTATLTFQLQAPARPVRRRLYGIAFIEDGAGGRWERPTWLTSEPLTAYLPFVTRAD